MVKGLTDGQFVPNKAVQDLPLGEMVILGDPASLLNLKKDRDDGGVHAGP